MNAFHSVTLRLLDRDLLDIRQFPSLVEQRFLRPGEVQVSAETTSRASSHLERIDEGPYITSIVSIELSPVAASLSGYLLGSISSRRLGIIM
jgi:hypothetical protein